MTPSVVQVMFEVGQVVNVEKRLRVVSDGNEPYDSVQALFQIPVNRQENFNVQSQEILSQFKRKQLKKYKAVVPHVLNIPPYALLLHVDTVHSKVK